MATTAYFPSQEASARKVSVWHKLCALATQDPTPTTEDAIAAYLDRHQYDLPSALRIELERRRVMP